MWGNKNLRNVCYLVLSFIAGLTNSVAEDTVFESGEAQVSLLELYTSEGCSSCPPADQWFSQLKTDDRLWKELVPVAFHVDYWNYIGWEDRFSSSLYSDRQRNYAKAGNLRTVYTPGMVLNGKEWKFFFGLRDLDIEKKPKVGKLIVKVEYPNLKAVFRPDSASKGRFILNVAVLGFDFSTNVAAGENRGRELKNDFVVLSYHSVPIPFENGGYRITTDLPSPTIKASRFGLAAWVNSADNLTPIQSVGGWIKLPEM